MKRGVVLMNFGGPSGPSDVTPFLRRLFSVPEILPGVPPWLRPLLAELISLLHGRESRRIYGQIAQESGVSPLLHWTQFQAEAVQRVLGDGTSPGHLTRVTVGMRASEPSLAVALTDLLDWGAEELFLVPLFPQFSTTTTGACLSEVGRVLAARGCGGAEKSTVSVHWVRSWATHPDLIRLWKEFLARELMRARAEGGRTHVVFCAHSLPVRTIERGDPYLSEVRATVEGVVQGLDAPWTLAFQSAGGGPVKWLGPDLQDELRRLGREGVASVVVVPISFVSDHVETLWELDQLSAKTARQAGIRCYRRVPTFNGELDFSRLLVSLLAQAEPFSWPT